MVTVNLFTLIILALCILGLGICLGAVYEVGNDLRQLKDQLYQTDRDIEKLEKMEKEYSKAMQDLKDWEKRYEDAYTQAMDIITEASEKGRYE